MIINATWLVNSEEISNLFVPDPIYSRFLSKNKGTIIM